MKAPAQPKGVSAHIFEVEVTTIETVTRKTVVYVTCDETEKPDAKALEVARMCSEYTTRVHGREERVRVLSKRRVKHFPIKKRRFDTREEDQS